MPLSLRLVAFLVLGGRCPLRPPLWPGLPDISKKRRRGDQTSRVVETSPSYRPKDPHPPNSGGDDFTRRIWGVWVKKRCKTRDF